MTRTLTDKAELNYLKVIFFLFGFLIMSWVPRFPEAKANLDISNGEFGSIISSSTFGAIAALLTVGHLVHNHGVKPVLRICAILLASSLIVLVTTHSAFIFLLSNIIQASAIAGFHIAINAQGFNFQDRTLTSVIVRLSGFWSSGALTTAILAGVLVNRVSLAVHITVLSIIVLLVIFIVISALGPRLLQPNPHKEMDYKITDIFKGFRIDTLVSGAFFCAVFLEYALGDWAAIYVKEDIGIKSGIHTLPYILFTLMMIIGRFGVHLLYSRYSLQLLMKIGSLTSGISFLLGIFITRLIGPENRMLILTILCISFAVAGLGSSFLAPSVMNIANSRSTSPASVVIGQMGVINGVAVFIVRLIIAWTAQAFSLSIALVIPAILLFAIPYLSRIFKRV